jgi:oligosaccharide repeat unit polymerase
MPLCVCDPHCSSSSTPYRAALVLAGAIVLLLLLTSYAKTLTVAVLLLGFLVLACGNYYLGGRDVLYPAFTFTLIWCIVAAVYCFCPMDIDSLGVRTVDIVLGGGVCLSLGSLLGNRPFLLGRQRVERKVQAQPQDSPKCRLLLLTYVVLSVPLFIHDTARIAGGISFSPMFFVNLRLVIIASVLNGSHPYSSKLVSTAPTIAILTLWVLVMDEKRKWAIALCFSCVVVLALLETNRSTIMQVSCGLFALVMLQMKDRTFRKSMGLVGIAALGGIVILTAITLLTKVETQGSDRLKVAADMTPAYIVGPLAGFNYAVYHPEAFGGRSTTTLADVLLPLSRLGIIRYTPPGVIDEFVAVPFPMNVYTCFKPYYEDFGVIGCLAVFVLIGFVEGRLFYAAVHGNQIAAFLFAYLSYSVMFSTFDDSYHLLNKHLSVAFFGFAYFCLLKRVRVTL